MNNKYCECCDYTAKDNWALKEHFRTQKHQRVQNGDIGVENFCEHAYKDGRICGKPSWDKLCGLHNNRAKAYQKSEKVKKAQKEYVMANTEKVKAKGKKWRETNAAPLKVKKHEYYEANKEQILEQQKQHYYNGQKLDFDNVCVRKIRGYRHKDIKHGRGITESDFITVDWLKAVLLHQENKCEYCAVEMKLFGFEPYDPVQFSVDRLNNNEAHHQENCVISCSKCNLEKPGE